MFSLAGSFFALSSFCLTIYLLACLTTRLVTSLDKHYAMTLDGF